MGFIESQLNAIRICAIIIIVLLVILILINIFKNK